MKKKYSSPDIFMKQLYGIDDLLWASNNGLGNGDYGIANPYILSDGGLNDEIK